jgi:hypothetical protein
MPETLKKQPAETRTFTMDFSPRLPTGVALSSISSVAERTVDTDDGTRTTTSDLTFVSQSLSTPNVSLQISGGTDNTLYEVTVVCACDNADIVEGEGLLLVCDT